MRGFKFLFYCYLFLRAEKIQTVEMDELDTAAYAEKRKEYRRIFFQ